MYHCSLILHEVVYVWEGGLSSNKLKATTSSGFSCFAFDGLQDHFLALGPPFAQLFQLDGAAAIVETS